MTYDVTNIMPEPTVSLRDDETLADYAIRVTRERDEAERKFAEWSGTDVPALNLALRNTRQHNAELGRERDEARLEAEARQQALIDAQIRHSHEFNKVCVERDEARAVLGAARATVSALNDEARDRQNEITWLLGLLAECASLLDREGIPTPDRQVMLARIHAALEAMGGRDD